jgi:netrin-G3 ligand
VHAAGGTSDAGYINANFVRGETRERVYIAAMAPLPATIPTFWQMLFEQVCLLLFLFMVSLSYACYRVLSMWSC